MGVLRFTHFFQQIIDGNGCPAIMLSLSNYNDIKIGVAYSNSITASGGASPYTYTVTSGALPTGLSLDTNTGAISGTPTSQTQASFTITATDANACTAECVVKLTPLSEVGASLMKTGQTTSYRTGDDGDIEAGRATNFATLASNNPFGNTNRFTDELGGQTYTNNIVIDWSTYDGSTVLGYRSTDNGVNINWNNSIDGALAVSIGSFNSGWRLPNINELSSLLNYSLISGLNYSPFNINALALWTSTTSANSITSAYILFAAGNFRYLIETKTVTTSSGLNCRYIPVRTFTVTGTTLS